MAEYAKANPNHDIGLHLTLSSEWEWNNGRPAAPRNEVNSLVDANGYFYNNCNDFAKNAKPEEIEREPAPRLKRQRQWASNLRILIRICDVYFPTQLLLRFM
ncbi:MAG: ChbG/HpnK family deacetylase [Saprospiraceae bacterium]|nr:ChbG/HpnK family deacetylase [Saprospiraceae bacterium]